MEKHETLGKRFGAMILDFFVLVPVTIVITFVLVFIDRHLIALSSILSGFISVLYYILMHYHYGQTVGKMIVNVKVLDASEASINFGQSILRSLPQLIPVMFAVSFSTADNSETAEFWARTVYAFSGAFYLIDALVCAASEKHRALHDFIAGTVVVRTDV